MIDKQHPLILDLSEEFEKLIKTNEEIEKKYFKIIEKLEHSLSFYKSRCELFQKIQKYMRDPERTIVCDILANNSLLSDSEGNRYGQDLLTLIKNDRQEKLQND